MKYQNTRAPNNRMFPNACQKSRVLQLIVFSTFYNIVWLTVVLHEIKVVFNILVVFLCVCVCGLLEIKCWFLMFWLINRFKQLMQALVEMTKVTRWVPFLPQ